MNKKELVLKLSSEGLSQIEIANLLSISKQYVNQLVNPEKHQARALLNNAVKRGVIKIPTKCEDCGTPNIKLQAHHPNHAKPMEVLWLCSTCHGKRDSGVKHSGRRYATSTRNRDPNNRHRCLDCDANFSTVTHREVCGN